MVKLTKIIEALPITIPFVGPEALARKSGSPIKARMGANENVFGPSPKVIEALRVHAVNAWQYGDPETYELKHAVAKHLGIEPENVVIGEGIDGLHGLAVRMFLEAGDKVVSSLGAYPTFGAHVKSFGGDLNTVPFAENHEDIHALLRVAKIDRPKLLYFCNPDNPMGTWWPEADVQNLINEIPEETMLLLDEAYSEFAPEGTIPPLDTSRKNVLRFRTFSKAYGLAGMRVGYAIGHADVIVGFEKIRNHFGVTRLSQVASVAALADESWLAFVKHEVHKSRERIYRIAKQNGLAPITSATNFVTIDCGVDGAYAKAIVDGLLQHGLFIRMPGVAPLNHSIRISCGKEKDLELLSEALPLVLSRLRERT
jgi:histidinol-phosphate aminotransferase